MKPSMGRFPPDRRGRGGNCDGLSPVVASATLGHGAAGAVAGEGVTHNKPLMKLFPLRAWRDTPAAH